MLDDNMKDQMPLFGTIDPPAKNPPPPESVEKQVKAPVPKPAAPVRPARTKVATASKKPVTAKRTGAKQTAVTPKVSGAVPDGDVRLTANIRQDLHLRLKIEAAHRRTTIGELIEEFVERYL